MSDVPVKNSLVERLFMYTDTSDSYISDAVHIFTCREVAFMKACRPFTSEEVQTLVELYQTHLPIEIAKILGRSSRVIHNKIRFIGITDKVHEELLFKQRKWATCEQKHGKEIKQLLTEMYWESEMSLCEMSKILGVNSVTVHNWMKDLNIPRRTDADGVRRYYSKLSDDERIKHISAAHRAHKECCSLVKNRSRKERRFRRDDAWLAISGKVKTRDGYKCTKCDMTEEESYNIYGSALCVHHVIPYHICRKHEISNLVTLCTDCHLRIHRKSWWDEVREQRKLLASEK